jgi:hypothetical protein
VHQQKLNDGEKRMPSPRRLAVLLLTALFALPCLANGPAAVENPTFPIDPVKMAVELSVKKLAEMGYNTNCRAKDLKYNSDDSWYCGLFAKLSGADKTEWKDRLVKRLTDIETQISTINRDLEKIRQRQETLASQNEQILTRINEVGAEATIGKSVSQIRLDWKNEYVPLFTGTSALTEERALAFAHRIVFTDELHRQIGIINDQLTQNSFGNDTLLRSYGRRFLQSGTSDLDKPYEYIEAVLQGLIAEERRGYVMYVWAAETLQSSCEMGGDCTDAKKLPHTAVEFRRLFAGYLDQQLAEFNSAIEFTVLARCDTHRRSAFILPDHGLRVLARADFFTSAMLEDGYGLRGRVISMGDGFDGNLALSGNQPLPPTGMITMPPVYGPRVDFWRATKTPNVYDEIRLGDRWKIYHYHVKGLIHATKISTSLPYTPKTIELRPLDLGTAGHVFAGSFTAIERAGGGYALLSGTGYDHLRSEPEATILGALHRKSDHGYINEQTPYAGFLYGGQLEWEVNRGVRGQDQHIEAKRGSYARSKKEIRFPQEGQLALGVELGDTYKIVCPGGACSDHSPFVLMKRGAEFKKGGFGSREARMNTRAAVVLGTDEKSNNGIVWKRDSLFSSPIDERVEIRKDSAPVTLEANQPYKLIFGGETDLDIQTSGANASSFLTDAVVVISNAYLGE